MRWLRRRFKPQPVPRCGATNGVLLCTLPVHTTPLHLDEWHGTRWHSATFRLTSGFCPDCPDHEGCATGYPCSLVRAVNQPSTR